MPIKSTDQDVNMKNSINNLIPKIEEVRINADNENRMIYFKSVPNNPVDLLELPRGKITT
jgi:hypothetical protein